MIASVIVTPNDLWVYLFLFKGTELAESWSNGRSALELCKYPGGCMSLPLKAMPRPLQVSFVGYEAPSSVLVGGIASENELCIEASGLLIDERPPNSVRVRDRNTAAVGIVLEAYLRTSRRRTGRQPMLIPAVISATL